MRGGEACLDRPAPAGIGEVDVPDGGLLSGEPGADLGRPIAAAVRDEHELVTPRQRSQGDEIAAHDRLDVVFLVVHGQDDRRQAFRAAVHRHLVRPSACNRSKGADCRLLELRSRQPVEGK